MKKLLLILTGLSVSTLPITSVISCANTRIINYKNSNDIEKYWNNKLNNTISIWDIKKSEENTKDISYKTNVWRELQKIIVFQFDNQEDVKKALESEDEKISDNLKFYTTKNEKSEIKKNNMEDLIKKVKKEDQKIYFTYKKENGDTSKFLELKITNKVHFEKDFFDTAIFTNENFLNIPSKDRKQEYNLGQIHLSKNDIIKLPSSDIYNVKNQTKLKTFIKTLLRKIKLDKNNNFSSLYDLIANKLDWTEIKKPNKNPYFIYKNLSPEAQVYNYFKSKSDENDSLLTLITGLQGPNGTGELIFKSKTNTYKFTVFVKK